jgi:hypothetical protein
MAATPAFASFEQEWLDAHPEYAIASIFLPSAQRRRENAFAVPVHELRRRRAHARTTGRNGQAVLVAVNLRCRGRAGKSSDRTRVVRR